MSKHTLGPWRASGSVKLVGDPDSAFGAHNLWCGEIAPDDPVYRGPICAIQSADQIDGISREEAEANARLIAAAPEMLAALDECAEWLGDEPTSEYPSPHDARVKALIRAVRAAIAKARGA